MRIIVNEALASFVYNLNAKKKKAFLDYLSNFFFTDSFLIRFEICQLMSYYG